MRSLVHTTSLALIPDPSKWGAIQDLREKYRDAGLFRWPPHINFIYPFVLPQHHCDMVERLTEVEGSFCEPFEVSFSSDNIGVFGGPANGVLWLRPESGGRIEKLHAEIVKGEGVIGRVGVGGTQLIPPLPSQRRYPPQTQALDLPNQTQRPFVPHLTISHFPSRDDAEEARSEIIAAGDSAFPRVTFTCDRLAMLQRNGASGQFFANREFLLGEVGGGATPWEMPFHYPGMPKEEYDWLPRVRGDLNSRRRRNKHKKGR